jgi:transcriptional regulator with XRE-family HTH domain
MKMTELMKMIRERQGGLSTEEYANKMGIRQATLWRYYNMERKISLDILQRLARFYREQGDSVMIEALSAYAIGDGESSSQQ